MRIHSLRLLAAGGLILAASIAVGPSGVGQGEEAVHVTFPSIEGGDGFLADRVALWEEESSRKQGAQRAEACAARWEFDSKEELDDWTPLAELSREGSSRSFLDRLRSLILRLRGRDLRIRDGVLRFRSQPIVCMAGLGLRTSDVREVTLRLRASAGSTFRIWYGDPEAHTHRFRVIEGDLAADGEFHTYRVLVRGFSEWAEEDPLTRFTILPSDAQGAPVEIDSLCLISEEGSYRARRVGVERVRLGRMASVWGGAGRAYDEYSGRYYKKSGFAPSEERRSVFALTPAVLEFPLRVPDGASLRMGCASLNPDAKVSFEVAVAEGEQVTSLHTATVPKEHQWLDAEVDLSRFAGREVTLILKASSPERPNVAFWSHPRVRGASESPAKTNILIYLLDALNPAHLGIYGASRDTSPTLDRLAREGAFFTHCSAPSSWTKTSVVSLFTSFYAEAHGVTSYASRLEPSQPTLADLMRRAGYNAASFLTNPHAGSAAGLDRGFDYLFSVDTTEGLNERILAWLRAHGAEPFFIYAHSVETHMPYVPPAPYDTMFLSAPGSKECASLQEKAEHAKALYDGAIRYNDAVLGELLGGMERLGLKDRTLIIVTSDHGEAFFAHDELSGHQSSVYNDQISVPLILRLPGIISAGRAIEAPASLVDILPTISDLLGFDHEAKMEGVSLLPLLNRDDLPQDRKIYSQETTGFVSGTSYACVIDGRWKCILDRTTGKVELYDLEVDADEQDDLAWAQPAKAAAYREHLIEWLRAEQKISHRTERPEIIVSPEERERLRGLGYLE